MSRCLQPHFYVLEIFVVQESLGISFRISKLLKFFVQQFFQIKLRKLRTIQRTLRITRQ